METAEHLWCECELSVHQSLLEGAYVEPQVFMGSDYKVLIGFVKSRRMNYSRVIYEYSTIDSFWVTVKEKYLWL